MSAQPAQILCQDVTVTEYGEKSGVCMYIVRALSV